MNVSNPEAAGRRPRISARRRRRRKAFYGALIAAAVVAVMAFLVPWMARLGGAQRDRLVTIENRLTEDIEFAFIDDSSGEMLVAYHVPAGETVKGILVRLRRSSDPGQWMRFPLDYVLTATGKQTGSIVTLEGQSTDRVIPRNVDVHIRVVPAGISLTAGTNNGTATR